MIDLHSHVLHGVDDGARSLEEGVAMCRQAARDGATAIVATPHLRHPSFWNDDRDALEALWLELRASDPGLEVYLGGEIAVCSESLEEIDQLPGGELLTMAGSRYLLLELDWRGLGPNPLDLVHEVSVAGWRPIIAHPERVNWLADDLDLLAALFAHGAALQLTAMSITGELGWRVRERSEAMLDAGLVHLVSSDAHDLEMRRPGLAAARAAVAGRLGEAVAQALFTDNPRAVLDDRPLPPPPAPPPAGGLTARLRRLTSR